MRRLCSLLSLLALASAARAQETVNLTYWTWGGDEVKALVDRFNATHPGIKVTWNNVPSNGFYDKLFTALKAGNAPDATNVEYQMLPSAISTGGLLDMAPLGGAALKSSFEPWLWNQVNLGGGLFAIPQDVGPMAMLYRADLLKRYQIAVPSTWAQFADAAAKLKAADPKAYLTTFALNDAGWFTGLAWQAGGRWFRIDGDSWVVSINDDATKRMAQYWQGLIDKKLVKAGQVWNDSWYGDLQSGGVSSWLTASWGTGVLSGVAPKTSGQWKAAPLPRWSANQAVSGNWGGSATAITKSSKHPKEAATFAIWLGTNLPGSLLPRVKTGLFPASKRGFDAEALNRADPFFGNQRVTALYRSASRTVNPSFQFGPTMPQVYGDLSDAFGEVAAGRLTLVQALDTVQAKTVAFMKKQGLSVKE